MTTNSNTPALPAGKIPEVGTFRAIDRVFARFLHTSFDADEWTALAAMAASALVDKGHSCFNLAEQYDLVWVDEAEKVIPFPDKETMLIALRGTSPSGSSAVGKPGERKPLILDGMNLYLYRHYNFERQLSERLRTMSVITDTPPDAKVIALAGLLFKDAEDYSAYGGQLQVAGAFLPFFSRLSIITGGPGTGKTTVLANLLALIYANALVKKERRPVIKLAAQTAKAAQRMGEAIRNAVDEMPEIDLEAQENDIKTAIVTLKPSTLHRLLGMNGYSPKPKYDSRVRLEADIVVVDEASMMDVTMFARLTAALPDHSRLILLGDPFQLASIETGCVLADICAAYSKNTFSKAFADCVNQAISSSCNPINIAPGDLPLSPLVKLEFSHRFKGDDPIGVVSNAVNDALIDDVVKAFASAPSDAQISLSCQESHPLRDCQSDTQPRSVKFCKSCAQYFNVKFCRLSPHPGVTKLISEIHDEYVQLNNAPTYQAALDQLKNFSVLTVLNEGQYGRSDINARVVRSFGERLRVRPIKITENSYQHNLFNGDMGVIFRSKDNNNKYTERAWFPADTDEQDVPSLSERIAAVSSLAGAEPPQTEEHGKYRSFLIGALPAYVDAFAITIHNSQGSEYNKVAIVLPGKDTQLLTRELLYTAITRAKRQVEIFGSEEIVTCAVARENKRHSGLAARIKTGQSIREDSASQ